MSDVLDSRWRISDEATANQVGEETVILHFGNAVYYGLDVVGTKLWEGLKQGIIPREICKNISEAYEIDLDIVHCDIEEFLGELARHNLVVVD